LVSIAAGLKLEKLAAMSGGDYPVIRVMPNLCAEVGEGMILYTPSANVTAEELAVFRAALAQAGRLDEIPEDKMDAASAIAGCAPAFAYMFMAALADGGVMAGLTYDAALQYAAQVLRGAAGMIQAGKGHPEALKTAVCSPAGSTIAGVKVLEDMAFRSTVMTAIDASYHKTAELGK
jgi:pyrroline-5-carboxylate reductase